MGYFIYTLGKKGNKHYYLHMKAEYYRIGELAEKSGVTIRTIRYYEEMGLLHSKTRTRGGQRTYANSDFVYIKRIKELQVLGFSLEEIKKSFRLKEAMSPVMPVKRSSCQDTRISLARL
jgi:Predicted transcriptional regulators